MSQVPRSFKTNDAILKVGWDAPFTIEISKDSSFSKHATICLSSSQLKEKSADGLVWDNKLSIKFKGKLGTLEIQNAWTPEKIPQGHKQTGSARVAWYVSLPFANMTLMVDQSDDKDADCHFLGWELKFGQRFESGRSGGTPEALRRYEADLRRLKKQGALFTSWSCVRLTVWKVALVQDFTFDQAREVMAGAYKQTLAETGNEWVRKHSNAVQAEVSAAQAILNILARDGCFALITSSTKLDILRVEIETRVPNDNWSLELGMKVISKDNMYFVQTVGDAEVEREEEEEDEEGDEQELLLTKTKRVWSGKVVLTGRNRAVVEIPASIDECQRLGDHETHSLRLWVNPNNIINNRLLDAIVRTDSALRYERGEYNLQSAQRVVNTALRVQMAPMLLSHEDVKLKPDDFRPFPLYDGTEQLFVDWSLGLDFVQTQFLHAVHQGLGGFAGLVGPLGTGKSFTIGHMAAFSRKNFANFGLKHMNKIVLCAHSNQATQVLLQKCAEILPTYGLDAQQEIVYIESDTALDRRRKKTDLTNMDRWLR